MIEYRPIVTPLVRYLGPSSARQEIWLKDESRQITGAFKARGNFHRLSKEIGPTHVVTASTGNHGLGLAAAAKALGHRATVFLPIDTPAAKRNRLAEFHAEIFMVNADYDGCAIVAREHAARLGAKYIPSFDDDGIIEGHRELCREVDATGLEFDTVFAPVGGGGLVTACVRHWRSGRRVVGVELDQMPAMHQSLELGERVILPATTGPAEGLRVRSVGEIPFSTCMGAGIPIALVSIGQLQNAVRALWRFQGIRAEESGAASLAAALAGGGGHRCLCIVSGGNIDAERFESIVNINDAEGAFI